jgi:hypothetical protein
MPDISQWGKYGWSYLAADLTGAEKRYQSLLPKWGEERSVGLSTSRVLQSALLKINKSTTQRALKEALSGGRN